MRIRRIVPVILVALGLAAAGCGSYTTTTSVPFAQARAEGGELSGHLVLDDGRRLRVGGAHLLGDWVCASAGAGLSGGDVCVEATRVATLEREKRHARPGNWVGKGVALLAMSPVIAVWMHSEHQSDRKSEAAAAERAEERRREEARAAARGEVLPPPPTREDYRRQSAFYSLANCFHVSNRRETDGATLAGEVWKDRETCLEEAIVWFEAAGETDKARRLWFIRWARARHEDLICGNGRPGLRAPEPEQVGAAARTWMAEYRQVVADPRTYAFSERRPCVVRPRLGPEAPEPAGMTPEAARAEAMATFPLTDPARLAAVIDRQARQARRS